jgi:hypothetical protein
MIDGEALARGRVAQLVADQVYPGLSTENDEALDLELLAKERDNVLNPPEPMMSVAAATLGGSTSTARSVTPSGCSWCSILALCLKNNQ